MNDWDNLPVPLVSFIIATCRYVLERLRLSESVQFPVIFWDKGLLAMLLHTVLSRQNGTTLFPECGIAHKRFHAGNVVEHCRERTFSIFKYAVLQVRSASSTQCFLVS